MGGAEGPEDEDNDEDEDEWMLLTRSVACRFSMVFNFICERLLQDPSEIRLQTP